MTVCIAWLKMAWETGNQEHRQVSRRDHLPVLSQWLERTLLAAGSKVFHYCTLKGKYGGRWRMSKWRKCKGLIKVKR